MFTWPSFRNCFKTVKDMFLFLNKIFIIVKKTHSSITLKKNTLKSCFFSVFVFLLHFCETNNGSTPDFPLQQFANCHDFSLQQSVKCLSGFQKTLAIFSSHGHYVTSINGCFNSTINTYWHSESAQFVWPAFCTRVYRPIIKDTYWSESV